MFNFSESESLIDNFNNRWGPIFEAHNSFKRESSVININHSISNIWNGEISSKRNLNNRNCRVTVEHPEEKKEDEEKFMKPKRKQLQPIHSMGPNVTVEDWDPDQKS